MSKGYYNMRTKGQTKPDRKDPRYVEAFDWARDFEYTVNQARIIANSVVYLMDQDSTLTVREAIYKTLNWDKEQEKGEEK